DRRDPRGHRFPRRLLSRPGGLAARPGRGDETVTARPASTPAVVLHLFLQTARLKKKRAMLTVASIAWGTVSVLLLLAFGQGFREQLLRNERGMGRNISIVWAGQTSKPFSGMPPGRRISFAETDA